MDKQWIFPSNNHGLTHGISDAALEGFKSGPVKSLAREICQNSLDAGIQEKPVRIEFDMFEIQTNEFPGISYFRNVIDRSISTWKNEKSQKTVKALNHMKEVMNQESINFLRISDFNTTGLRGSNKHNGTEWHNLVKATGSSAKTGTTGGSFGIGKNATFVCSEIRTVFYSTKDIDGLEATQGVARLVSFNLGDPDDPTLESQGTGYYGEPYHLMPLKYCLTLQPGYHREEFGTDIYIAAYKEEFKNSWEKVILKEIIDNYFYAIYQGTLEIKIANIVVNKGTLKSVVEKYKDDLSVNSVEYYRVLTSASTIWEEIDFDGFGNIKTGFLINDESNIKRVAMIRKPWMKIKEDKLNDIIPFSAVLIVEGEKLNEELRRMEDPTHSKWDSNLLDSDIERKAGKNLLKKLREYLLQQLKEKTIGFENDEFELETANDFIPIEEDEDEQKTQSDIENLYPGIKEIEVKKVKKVITKSKGTSQEEAELYESGQGAPNESYPGMQGNGGNSSDKPNNPMSAEVSEEGSATGLIKQLVKTQFTKFFSTDLTKKHYRILVMPEHSAIDCSMLIYKLDEQNERTPVVIVSAKISDLQLDVKKNRINGFDLQRDQVKIIDFEIEDAEYFSAEVIIHGNQQ